MATSLAPHPTVGAPPVRPSVGQAEFDAGVRHNTNVVFLALGGVAIAAALAMSIIALVISTGARATGPLTIPMHAGVAAAAAPIDLSVSGSNKLGPDGKMHDSFSQTDFAVKVGQPTLLRINNTDSSAHSITAAATGVSITVLPGLHTYTLVAKHAGRFEWICAIPCDSAAHGWAMTHPGYMAGYITAN